MLSASPVAAAPHTGQAVAWSPVAAGHADSGAAQGMPVASPSVGLGLGLMAAQQAVPDGYAAPGGAQLLSQVSSKSMTVNLAGSCCGLCMFPSD